MSEGHGRRLGVWVGVGVQGNERILQESSMDDRTPDHIDPTHQAGFALPIVLSVLVMLGIMGVAALQAARDELLSAQAVSKSSQAFYAAEAGLHFALENWDQRAIDTLVADPGDSLATPWRKIPNRCGFRVVWRRIDGGDTGRKLYSLESTGRTPGLDGATQRIGIIVEGAPLVEDAVAFGGNLELSANPIILGDCGSIHSNGALDINANPTIAGTLSTSETANVGGTPVDEFGNPITVTEGVPRMSIPDLDPTDYCGEADFIFRSDGTALKVSTSESFDFAWGGTHWGWKWDSTKNNYISDSEFLEEGVYCVDGNMEISKDLGVPGDPRAITVLATGSVMISSNSYIKSAHSDSILVIAEGDLKLNGSPVGGNDNFEGLTYGGAQCMVSGTARLHGQLVCADHPNPPGSEDWAVENKISGNVEITYSCGGLLVNQAEPELIPQRMWTHLW